MTSATRGSVHRAVLKPCSLAPWRSAASTLANCPASSRGLRPARPAPFNPLAPLLRKRKNHRLTLWRLTASAFATSACFLPALNRRPARLRRCSMPSKSRRGRKTSCRIPMPEDYTTKSHSRHYIMRDSVSRDLHGRLGSCRPWVWEVAAALLNSMLASLDRSCSDLDVPRALCAKSSAARPLEGDHGACGGIFRLRDLPSLRRSLHDPASSTQRSTRFDGSSDHCY
jgi:hypothetical protein